MDMKEKSVLDGVIESIDNLLEEIGFEHIKMSETKDVHTTAYEAIIFKVGDEEYTITFDDSKDYNKVKGIWESTNYIDRALNCK